jgi:hypothetical protein
MNNIVTPAPTPKSAVNIIYRYLSLKKLSLSMDVITVM